MIFEIILIMVEINFINSFITLTSFKLCIRIFITNTFYTYYTIITTFFCMITSLHTLL